MLCRLFNLSIKFSSLIKYMQYAKENNIHNLCKFGIQNLVSANTDCLVNGTIDRQMNRWINGQIEKWIDREMDRQIDLSSVVQTPGVLSQTTTL